MIHRRLPLAGGSALLIAAALLATPGPVSAQGWDHHYGRRGFDDRDRDGRRDHWRHRGWRDEDRFERCHFERRRFVDEDGDVYWRRVRVCERD